MGGMGNSMGGSSSAMSPTMGPSAPLAPAHAARSSSSAVPSLQSAQMEDMALAQTVVGGRQGLYTGIGDGREPSPMAPTGPILDSHGSTVRRNAVPIAIGSAFGLAILSFLVVAAFMKKDEGSRAAAGPDAGPTTGAVTATVPSPPGGGTAPASTPSAGTPATGTPSTGTPATGTPSAAIVDAGVEPSESGTAKGGEPDVIPTPTPPGGKAGRSSARGTDRKPDRASSSKSSATRKKKKKKTTRKTTRSSEKKRGARNR
jgi:hypothetical protein